jgi:DNA damage-binding protein 1
MGVGEFLSTKAENEWILSERKREQWEMDNYPEGEIQEMIDIYTSRGMEKEDATIVIQTMAKYKDFFVDVMMRDELELQVPEPDHQWESFKNGFVMFCAFSVFGSLPLLGYIVIPWTFPGLDHDMLFKAACFVTGIVLFAMGSVKSIFRYVWIVSCLLTQFLASFMTFSVMLYISVALIGFGLALKHCCSAASVPQWPFA